MVDTRTDAAELWNLATLVVRVLDEEDEQALLRSRPDVVTTTPHHDG